MQKNKKTKSSGNAKRAYRAPKVRTYGNIRDITQNVGHSGNSDGAQSRPKKTALP